MDPQRHTPSAAYSIYKDFHILLTRLTGLVWNIQVCSVRSKIPLQHQRFDLNGRVKTYHNILPKMGIPTKWESQKPNNQLRPGILADGIKYTVSLSGKAFVRQPLSGKVSRYKYLRYGMVIAPCTVILLTTEGSQISVVCHMLEPKEIKQDKSVHLWAVRSH